METGRTGRSALARLVASKAGGYDLVRDTLPAQLAARFPADLPPGAPDRFEVGAQELVLLKAIVTVGGRDADVFEPLAGAVVRRVAALDRSDPDAVQPNLSVLGVLNGLQIMGVEVPEETVRTGAGWLLGMQTAGIEHEWMHWTRGLAALALGDLVTARTVAALAATGPVDADPRVSPGFSIQGWFALLVVAVERGLPWAELRPRWEEFLLLLETFVEMGELSERDLPWVGRVFGHQIAGRPLGAVADWVHAEVHRIAGLDLPR